MEKQISPWIWNGDTDFSIPDMAIGYVYKITMERTADNYSKVYIGKKLLNSTRRTRIGIREKKSTKTRKTFKKVVKDSGWQSYWSSCKPLQELVKEKGEQFFKREIIQWCYTKKQMTYYELKAQFIECVLEIDSFNDNINGSIYRRDLINKEL